MKGVPKGYHTVTPYLVVKGVPKLAAFLKRALGARVVELVKGRAGAVTHAEVQIGDSKVMMGEARPGVAPSPAMLYLYVADVDAAYRRAIKAGATSILKPIDQFYGDRTGGVRDAWGNQWWMATRRETLTKRELARRAADARG